MSLFKRIQMRARLENVLSEVEVASQEIEAVYQRSMKGEFLAPELSEQARKEEDLILKAKQEIARLKLTKENHDEQARS